MRKFLLVFLIWLPFNSVNKSMSDFQPLWKVQSIDTVQQSRDRARELISDKDHEKIVDREIALIAQAGSTHVSLGTPYDQEFIIYLKRWVDAARRYGLNIWFRGNLAGAEGWFDYPKFTENSQHHQEIFAFITQNPELFIDGDIFTTAPEPENGWLGDPRQTGKKEEFNKFLIESYNNCLKAFTIIRKNVDCGYFSVNADIAKEIITKQTAEKIGGRIVIDHYRSTTEQFGKDLEEIRNKFHLPLVLGEIGAPIPDLHRGFNETQQATFIDGLLKQLWLKSDYIEGVNYWSLRGGSTALVDDRLNANQAYVIISNYFRSRVVSGTVRNSAGQALSQAKISVNGELMAVTDKSGRYRLKLPQTKTDISFDRQDYQKAEYKINTQDSAVILKDVNLFPATTPPLWYRLKETVFHFAQKYGLSAYQYPL